MNAATFDTLKVARDLEAAGVERRQAEAHATAIVNTVRDAAAASHTDLATKADLAALESRLIAMFIERENRLVKWAVALAGAVVIILGVLIRWP